MSNNLVSRERSVRGDTPDNHAGETGSIPVSRSIKFQDMTHLHVEEITTQIAKPIILEKHYSHKWNDAFGRQNFGLYKNNVLLGVAVFGYPMNPKAWSSITSLNGDACIELNRLWVHDQLMTNSESWFISQSSQLLKQKGYRLIQSFADSRLGVGTIYQAANFGYYGFHVTLFHEHTETKEVFHGSAFRDTRRIDTMIKRNVLHAQKVLTSFKVKTYRYLLPLDKAAKRSILLIPQTYPKVRDGVLALTNYTPAISQIARAAALAKKTHRHEDFVVLKNYLRTITNDFDAAIVLQSKNGWVDKINIDVPLFEF